MEQTLAMRKSALRQQLRAQRRGRGPRGDAVPLCRELQRALTAAGRSSPALIAGFVPTPDEPDVLTFLEQAVGTGAAVVMPRTLPDSGMEWVPWRPGSVLLADRHGLQAPAGDALAGAGMRLSVILVPALAVDVLGHRLGQGGGYYDRALQHLPRWPAGPLRIGVVHPEGALEDPIPHAPHDEGLDMAVWAGGGRWSGSATL